MMDKLESLVERFDPGAVLRAGVRVALVLAALGGGIALAGQCAGCGATAGQHHARLNALTTVADPTYAIAVETCDALRDGIVLRSGTTYAEDRAAMDEIHAVCDPMVAGFEALRGSQLTARAAIDGGAEGAVLEAISAALALWPTVQQMIARIDALGRVQ
jgi:hypothetical protein